MEVTPGRHTISPARAPPPFDARDDPEKFGCGR